MLRLKKRFQLILISVVLFLVVGFFFHSAVSSRAQDPPGSELTYPGYVERSFPVPDRCLSPSGLAWDGEHLWLGDEGGWLFKVQSDDGVLIETFSPLGVVCSGMSWDEATDTLLFTDGTSPTVYRFHPAERTSEPIYTASGSPQIQGIACCSSGVVYLIDRTSGKILKANIETKEEAAVIPGLGWDLRSLCWDGKYVWAVDNREDRIFLIDLQRGKVISSLRVSGGDPTGWPEAIAL